MISFSASKTASFDNERIETFHFSIFDGLGSDTMGMHILYIKPLNILGPAEDRCVLSGDSTGQDGFSTCNSIRTKGVVTMMG